MRRLVRKTTDRVVQGDHERRIQMLERRYPGDYPRWCSALMDQVTVTTAEVPDSFSLGWSFPDPEPCEEPDCEPLQCHTVGEYFLLPQGFQGPFWIYMTVVCGGGCADFPDYFTTVDPTDFGYTKYLRIFCNVEIWRDDAPFGSTSLDAFQEITMAPPPTIGISQIRWNYKKLHPGNGILNQETDRYALRPLVFVESGITGTVTIDGGVFAVELTQEGYTLSGQGL